MASHNGKITWTNEKRRLGDLIPWPRNPRMIKQDQGKRLVKSLEEFNQVEPIAIGPGNVLYNGHQRLNVWGAEYGADLEVDVRVASRPLTEKEREKLTVYLHKGAAGEWDWDMLSDFDIQDLLEWGFSENELDMDVPYNRNVEAPIYTPKGDKPAISELFDDTRAKELLAEIEVEELPDDEKEFLTIAARRHTVLNFKRIAEYYAHSSEKVQRLMENSALIIIDFNRAIELGYVNLSENIMMQYKIDYGNEE